MGAASMRGLRFLSHGTRAPLGLRLCGALFCEPGCCEEHLADMPASPDVNVADVAHALRMVTGKVAVADNATREIFIDEIETLRQFLCPRIVKSLGRLHAFKLRKEPQDIG
jgi:hypothetical protein